MLRLLSMVLLTSGLFILVASFTIPANNDYEKYDVSGHYSTGYDSSDSYELYPGQTLTIYYRSNFTLQVDVLVFYRNGTRANDTMRLNNITIDNIDEGFPVYLFREEEGKYTVTTDQLAEVEMHIQYSRNMIFPQNMSDVFIPAQIYRTGTVMVKVTSRNTSGALMEGVLFVALAILTELGTVVYRRVREEDRTKQMELEEGKPRRGYGEILRLFLMTKHQDGIFVMVMLFSSLILFSLWNSTLFSYMLSTAEPELPLGVENMLLQLVVLIYSLSIFLTYSNLGVEDLTVYWTLPLSRRKYLLTSVLMTTLRAAFFTLSTTVMLTEFTLREVYGIVPSPQTSVVLFLNMMRVVLMLLGSAYIFTIFLNKVMHGAMTTSLLGAVLYMVTLSMKKMGKRTWDFLFTTSELSSSEQILGWTISLSVLILVFSVIARNARRFRPE